MNQNGLRIRAAEVFLKAANYIRQYGWQVEGMSTHGQPRCSMGALASALPDPKWNNELASLMYERLYNELGGITLTEFNTRTGDGEKVALLYERVAVSLNTESTQALVRT